MRASHSVGLGTVAMVVCLVVALPACGSDDDESSTTPTTSLCDVVRLSDDECDLTKLLDIKDVAEKGMDLGDTVLEQMESHEPELSWRPAFTAWQDDVAHLDLGAGQTMVDVERTVARRLEALESAMAAKDALHIAQARAALCALPLIPC